VLHSADIAPPLGEPQLALDLGGCFGDSATGLLPPRDIAAKIPTSAGWGTPLVALWHILQQTPQASHLQTAGPAAVPRGLTLVLHSEIPMGAGQASSTALLVAVLRALSELANFILNRSTPRC